MRTARRLLIRGVAAGLLLILGYVLAAVGGAFWGGSVAPVLSQGTPVEIKMISGPIHYDFLLPLNEETRATFGFARDLPIDHPDAKWVIVGWGAREFYTTVGGYGDVTARAVSRGIFGDSSVLRMDVGGEIDPQIETRGITLAGAQYTALLASIAADFAETTAMDQPGFYETDRFFAAHGRFHIRRTCNQWVNEKLRAAGLEFGRWTPLVQSVDLSLWWHDH